MTSTTDSRTLISMLQLEENYTITGSYFNDKIKPEMRNKLATWMLEVCEEQMCTDDVYATAMNIFDRLMLTLNQVEVYHLQLLGSVCLFIASKLGTTQKLTATKLVDYTDNSITLEDLLEWELFVMDKLKWDICSIVPNEFIEIFLNELHINNNQDLSVLKRHCYAFTAMCATDFKFAQYPSSIIAATCILNALEGLGFDSQSLSDIAYEINELANIDLDFLVLIKDQVTHLFKQSSLETEPEQTKINNIEIEDDYDFNIDFNMNLNSNYEYTKASMLSPAPSSPASSSGVSSSSSLQSPSLFYSSSSFYNNQGISMVMITPPLANSLPMPDFDRFESHSSSTKSLRRTTRQSQRLIRC